MENSRTFSIILGHFRKKRKIFFTNLIVMLQETRSTLKRTFDCDDGIHQNFKRFTYTALQTELRPTNFEFYQLVAIVDDASEYADTKVAKLREIIDYVRIFYDIDQAKQYLEETTRTATFLIGTVNLAKKFVPMMHRHRQIQSIYLYHSSPATEQMDEYQMITSYKKVSFYVETKSSQRMLME